MRKLLSLFLSLSIITCFAQTSIWKIEKDGRELYLGGSIHILKKSDYPLPEEFNAAFMKSDKIVFEANIEELEDPAFVQSIMQKGLIEENKTLQDVLNTEVYQALEKKAAELSFPLAQVSRLKPSLVLVTMLVIKLKQIGIDAPGVDKYYFKKSKEHEKELSFLETLDEQFNFILSMSDGQENEFVKYSLADFEKIEEGLSDMTSTWRNGTSTVMIESITEMQNMFPSIYASLLTNRHDIWVPKIEKFLSDDTVEFIIVGSLHLHGTDGLLERLKTKGYQVDQFQP